MGRSRGGREGITKQWVCEVGECGGGVGRLGQVGKGLAVAGKGLLAPGGVDQQGCFVSEGRGKREEGEGYICHFTKYSHPLAIILQVSISNVIIFYFPIFG